MIISSQEFGLLKKEGKLSFLLRNQPAFCHELGSPRYMTE